MFCRFTLLSPSLGPGTALICTARRFSDWIDRIKYNQDPEHTYQDLLRQFHRVEEQAIADLKKYAGVDGPNCGKTNDEILLIDEILKRDTRYKDIHDPAALHLSTQDAGCLLSEIRDLRETYGSEPTAIQLEKLYTGFFFREMANRELLSKWFDFVSEKLTTGEYGPISEALLSCDRAEELIDGSEDLTRLVPDSDRPATKPAFASFAAKILDSISILSLYALLGAGCTFTVLLLMHTQLTRAHMIEIPCGFFLGEMLLSAFWKSICNRKWPKIKKGRRVWAFIISVFLRTVVAGTSVYIVSGLLGRMLPDGIWRWPAAFIAASLMNQLLYVYRGKWPRPATRIGEACNWSHAGKGSEVKRSAR